MIYRSVVSTVLILLLGRTAGAAPELERTRLERHVHYLASQELEGRGVDRPGGLKARAYIVKQFKQYGLQPGNGDSWLQPLQGVGRGANVLGLLPGSDQARKQELVIVGAHYDHLGRRGGKLYRGANDNAAGVATVLELARVLAARQPRPSRSVLFACWDYEEGGLHGSRHYTRNPSVPIERVAAYLDMDLIGRAFVDLLPRALFVFGSENGKGMREIVTAAAAGRKLQVLPLGADLIGPRCDFWNFRNKRVPYLFFTSGEHADYHQPTDLPERIDYDKLLEVARLIEGTLVRVAGAAERPAWQAAVRAPAEATTMAKLIRQVTEVARLEPVERLLWQLGAARLERISRKPRIGFSDRNAMRLIVAATLLRHRIRPFERKAGEEPRK